jgi:hypothetical protein
MQQRVPGDDGNSYQAWRECIDFFILGENPTNEQNKVWLEFC